MLVLIFWGRMQCVFRSLYTFLKVVTYYDLSVHVSNGFPKKFGYGGGWGELYPVFCSFGIF